MKYHIWSRYVAFIHRLVLCFVVFFFWGGAGVHTFRSSFIRVMQCALHGYVKMQDHVSPDINGPNLALARLDILRKDCRYLY